MVEVEGERVLAASCIRKPTPNMVVKTATDRAVKARRMVMELLLADQPPREDSPDRVSPFWHWAEAQRIETSRFPAHGILKPDLSHPAMAVNLDACIDCGLCVRACREVQVNDVIGMAFRNIGAKPVFDFDDPMGLSTCVACGECVQACPTGALMPKSIVDPITQHGSREVDREVHSVCPYCGVGCQISYQIKDEKIAFVQGRNGYSNENRLCVKGRFGFDYVTNPQRLMKPLIRKPGLPKRLDVDPSNPLTHFREASWDEALDFAANGLARVAEKHGNEAIAGFGSAKCTNEEAYLFQKLIRTRFRNNNVDHCTRLCHASSVAALIEGIGSGAVTATFNEVEHADVIMIIGANPTENHPVAATFFKQAAKRGAKLIVIDPRGSGAARIRDPHAAIQAGERRRAAQRHHARDRRGGALRRSVPPGLYREFRAPEGACCELQPRVGGRHLRHRRQDHPRRGPHLRPRRARDDLLGHGHLAACAWHRQCALPDRARR